LILDFQCAAWVVRPAVASGGRRFHGRLCFSFQGWGSRAGWLWRGQGQDPGEGFGDVAGPGPCGWYPQVAAALAFDDPPGGVQDLVAQRLRLGFGEVAVEGEEAAWHQAVLAW
jgi:hypothetical protein